MSQDKKADTAQLRIHGRPTGCFCENYSVYPSITKKRTEIHSLTVNIDGPPHTQIKKTIPPKITAHSIESLFSKSGEESTGTAIFVFVLEMTVQEWLLRKCYFRYCWWCFRHLE